MLNISVVLTAALLMLVCSTRATSNGSSEAAFVTPSFHFDRVLAKLPGVDLRDPTTAIWDPATDSWHMYCTHQQTGAEGYSNGTIAHLSLNSTHFDDPSVKWVNEGIVLHGSNIEHTFDRHAVFTPGAVRECAPDNSTCTWFLFFGGVADAGPAHAESIGVASAPSPWGPFTRISEEPCFSRFDKANADWCAAEKASVARLDEIKPLQGSDGSKYLAVKSVCVNATSKAQLALPVLYTPVNTSSWGPPYKPAAPSLFPLFKDTKTDCGVGFEEPTFFTAPDGLLHFIAHDHGKCEAAKGNYAHYVSESHGLEPEDWVRATSFGKDGPMFTEPIPVPRRGDGVFGGALFDTWIDFGTWLQRGKGKKSMQLVFSNVTWTWTDTHQPVL
jgi:hypothetical protein